MIEVRRYITPAGKDVVGEWLDGLKDIQGRARILGRIARLMSGNFGDSKSLGEGLHELRMDFGPGYRLYYSALGPVCVLLLVCGDKRKQSSDIERAAEYLRDYIKRGTAQ